MKIIREGLGAKKETTIIPFSASSKQGLEDIWSSIEGHLKPNMEEE